MLSLAMIGGILVSCSKNEVLSLSVKAPSIAYLKSQFRSASSGGMQSNVYIDEDGQIIKLNDPDDPSVNLVKELTITEPTVSMFYSDFIRDKWNQQKQLEVSFKPSYATLGSVTWSSSDPSIAKVDQNGLVTALKQGAATITATSENGVSGTSRVVVTNANIDISDAVASLNKIEQKQKSSEFEQPTTVYVREDYVFLKTKNGVVQSRDHYDERFWASTDQAYFRITSEDTSIKTAGGSVVPGFDSYVFYTTPYYFSYIYCMSDNKANYMVLDQSYLIREGKGPYNGLLECLGSFFTIGSKIMTNQFDNVLGTEVYTDKEYNKDKQTKYFGTFGEDSGHVALYMEDKPVSSGLTQDTEESLGIPHGTTALVNNKTGYLFENNLLVCETIVQTFAYEIAGEQWTAEFYINYYMQGRNVELYWPNSSDFTQVDSIFDL